MSNVKPNKVIHQYTTKLFVLGIEIIFYFGVPAVLGIFLGNWIENRFDVKMTIPLLFVTYILSWILVALRYRSLSRGLKKLREQEEAKNQEHILTDSKVDK